MASEDQTREQAALEAQITQAIVSCLEVSGKKLEVPVTADTVPLDDLEDFDSLCAIEVVVELEEKLHRELEEEVFAVKTGKKTKARSIREIAVAILSMQRAPTGKEKRRNV